jgi:hypothetical protein
MARSGTFSSSGRVSCYRARRLASEWDRRWPGPEQASPSSFPVPNSLLCQPDGDDPSIAAVRPPAAVIIGHGQLLRQLVYLGGPGSRFVVSARDRYGWDIDPADGRGVVRGRTKLGQLVVWLIPADPLQSVVEEELGKGLAHPGLYVLIDEQTDRVYIGESSNLRARLGQHLDHPPKELGRFDRALIVNDGRAAVHSRFNDSTLREALEQSAIKLFLDGEVHSVVNQQKKMPELSVTQQTLFEELRSELGHVLYELELITARPKPAVDSAIVRPQDVQSRFPTRVISAIKGYEGTLDGAPIYFRKGSEKSQGLQVTIRVGEPFGKAVLDGRGFLCYNRGRCYMIPNSEVRNWLGSKLKNQTVDIFLRLGDETLWTAGLNPMLVAQFGGAKSSSS